MASGDRVSDVNMVGYGSGPASPALPSHAAPSPAVSTPGIGRSRQTRQTHRKSRMGCNTCKTRKVKCDERRPACLNCIAYGTQCPFQQPSKGETDRRNSPFHDSPTSPGPPPDSLPLLELELLHNFSTYTSSTLVNDPAVQGFWRVNVVELGLECDYIMGAILAVSALHLAHSRPRKRDFYTAQGIFLHQKASRSAMDLMEKFEKKHDTKLFVFSALTVYFALASSRQPDGHLFIEDASFPDWTFLIGGAKSVADFLGLDRYDKTLQPFMDWGFRTVHARAARDQALSPPLSALRERIHGSVQDQELLRTYDFAIQELDLSLQSSDDPSTPRDVLDAMIWIWQMSDSLMPLLKNTTQEAVAIFAHFCILLKYHEDLWFLQGWADHLVTRAHDILDAEHRSWIVWPMEEMGCTPQ